MYGRVCSDSWRGCCRIFRCPWCALRRLVIQGYLIEWIVFTSRVFLLGAHIHCFLLLRLAFRYSNR